MKFNSFPNSLLGVGAFYSYGDSSRFERDSLLTPPGGGDQIAANVGREIFLSVRVFIVRVAAAIGFQSALGAYSST
jgi:hypothetical protein